MEDLKRLCEQGLDVTIQKGWQEIENAKKLLASHRYVQQDEDESTISFKKMGDLEAQISADPLHFPQATPAPQYDIKQQRVSTYDPAVSEWTTYAAFQHDTNNLPESQQLHLHAKVGGFDKMQTIGIKLLVQPFSKLDDAQLYVKLRVEKLVIGVKKEDFPTKEHKCLGYYPAFVGIMIQPQVEGENDLNVVPVLVDENSDLPRSPTSLVKETSTTTIGGRLGYGPASLNIEHSTDREVVKGPKKLMELVYTEDTGDRNAANFEWSILCWKDWTKYNHKKPENGSWPLKNPELPFRGSFASLHSDFPDILWRFPRSLCCKKLSFRIRLQVQMHLVWFFGAFIRSVGHKPASFTYANEWILQSDTEESQETPA